MKNLLFMGGIGCFMFLWCFGCEPGEDMEMNEVQDDGKISEAEKEAKKIELENEVPVYYLGSSEAALELQDKGFDVELVDEEDVADLGQTSGTESGSNARHILFFDGDYVVNNEVVRDDILAGNIVVELGRKEIVKSFFDDAAYQPNVTAVQSSENEDIENGVEPSDDSDLNSDTLDVIGYFYSPDKTWTFSGSISDYVDGIEAAYDWAIESMVDQYFEQKTGMQLRGSAPYWKSRFNRKFYSSTFNNVGRLNIINEYYQLINDGRPKYKFWAVHFRVQTIPNTDNEWINDYLYIKLDANKKYNKWMITSYSPTTDNNKTSESVNVSWGGASLGWSYFGNEVSTRDMGNLQEQVVAWKHTFKKEWNYQAEAARTSYFAEPGCVIRTGPNVTKPWKYWYEEYGIQYAKKLTFKWDHRHFAAWWN